MVSWGFAIQMSETTTLLPASEPAGNLGFVRFNWQSPGADMRPIILLVPPDSDCSVDLVDALAALGNGIDVWRLDACSMRAGRNRQGEVDRMRRAWKARATDHWVGVAPFNRRVAKLFEKTFADAAFVLLADDLAVIGVGGESQTDDIRRSMLDAARLVVDMAVFATSTPRTTMLISTRKAKEYPEAIIHAFSEFSGVVPDSSATERAAKLLGRPQVLVSVAPIRKLIATDAVRGGIEPIHKHGTITGWAKRALSAEPVDIGARANGAEIARTNASLVRQDLVLSGIGDGRHGFILDVSKALSNHPVRIEVFAVDSGFVLGAVDMNLERGERVPVESAPPVSVLHVAAE